MTQVRAFVIASFGIASLLIVSACGGSDGPTLTAEGERGRDLAKGAGCVACHGDDGDGGVGPGWTGLADSIVELDDGTTALADTEFLTRSIKEPNVDQTATYTLLMPANSLTDDEVAAVVTYIQELK